MVHRADQMQQLPPRPGLRVPDGIGRGRILSGGGCFCRISNLQTQRKPLTLGPINCPTAKHKPPQP